MAVAFAFLDIFTGNREAHAVAQAEYDATVAQLEKNRLIYGLPSFPAELSEEQQQILAELDVLALASHYCMCHVVPT